MSCMFILENMTDDFNTYGLHNLGKILTGYELVEEVATIVTSQTKIYNQLLAFLYPNLKVKDYYNDIKVMLIIWMNQIMLKNFA